MQMNMEENNNIDLGPVEDSQIAANFSAIKLAEENNRLINDYCNDVNNNKSKLLTKEQIEKHGFTAVLTSEFLEKSDSTGVYTNGPYWLDRVQRNNFQLRIGIVSNVLFDGAIGTEEEFIKILKKLKLYGRE